MEEILKLDNLYGEIQLIEDAKEKELIKSLYDQALTVVSKASPDALDVLNFMEHINMIDEKVEHLKLADFWREYIAKMLGGNE